MTDTDTAQRTPFVLRELTPPRFDADDAAGIKAQLDQEGFACIADCLNPEELDHARDLLWNHLEGTECPQMTQGDRWDGSGTTSAHGCMATVMA